MEEPSPMEKEKKESSPMQKKKKDSSQMEKKQNKFVTVHIVAAVARYGGGLDVVG
jgi:hypothetical protein